MGGQLSCVHMSCIAHGVIACVMTSGMTLLKSKLSRTDRRTFRLRFRWEMLIHIWISPKHWKDASGEKRSLGSDILYVFLCLETQVYK